MDLLVNDALDYVEFENLDQHWTGYVIDWNKKVDLEIFVDAGKTFRIRPHDEIYRDRYVVVFEALVDLGEYDPYPKGLSTEHWNSMSEPRIQNVRFMLKYKRWSYWVAVPIAIIFYLVK